MTARKTPSARFLVVIYGLFAAFLARTLVDTHGPDYYLDVLVVPVLISALYYSRGVYLTMGAISACSAVLVVSALFPHPQRSLGTIAALSVTCLVSCELLFRLARGRTRAEERLRQTTEQLQALIGASPLAIFALDLHGRVLSWNPAAGRLLGWRESDVAGTVLPLLEAPDETFADLHRQALSGATITDVETTCPVRGGGIASVSVSAAPLYDSRGQVSGMMAVLADVTARKEAEEAARQLIREQAARVEAEEAGRRMSLLAEASSILVASLDWHQMLQEAARLVVPEFADFVAVDLLVDGTVREAALLHADPARQEIWREIRRRYPAHLDDPHGLGRVLATGSPEISLELASSRLHGMANDAAHYALLRRLNLSAYLCVPLVARGHILGALTIATSADGKTLHQDDVSAVQELANRIALSVDNARLYQEAQRASEAKTAFLAMLAHELRNPLAAITNAAHLLNELPPADARSDRHRRIIERQTAHLSHLVDDLLDVSRINHGKVQLRRRKVEMAEIVHRAIDAARPVIDGRRHALQVQMPSWPVWVEADPTRLEQVLCNLLTNAGKYTDPGGRIWLDLELPPVERGRAPVVAIHVRDTGVGISRDMLPQIWDMFTQVDRSLDRSQGGMGLGLTLVRSLVEMHGGSVEARSDGLGCGSEFIVRLPLAAGEALRPNSAAVPIHPSSFIPHPSSRRVLVVDDNHDAAETLAEMLELWEYDVQTVHDGHAALEAVWEFEPEIVLLDIGLPGIDGYEVARRLRAPDGVSDSAASPFLVALTGYGQEDDRRRAREAGFDFHMVKPVDPEALRELLERVSANPGRCLIL